MKPLPSVQFMGIRVHAIHLPELLHYVLQVLDSGARARILYVNIHCINTSRRNRDHRRILNQADVVYCDGAGVRLGARLLGRQLPPRMTGADWIHDLCALCAEHHRSLFLLGGEPGVARHAREVLCQRHPRLSIVGTHHGFVSAGDKRDLLRRINGAHPDILLVGMGTPAQELWIDRHYDRLDVPVVWAVGALMDFVTGRASRAPHWMLNHGLEWLYRLLREPRRLGGRYLVGNVRFLLGVLRERGRVTLRGPIR